MTKENIMRHTCIVSTLAVLTMTIGCGGGPIDAGTSWTLKTTETSTRTSYWLRDGGTPVESVGPLGTASSCILAETSGGTSTSTGTSETFTVNTALGDTEMYHPLVPNDETFSSTMATVLQRRTRGAGSVESTRVVYDPNSVMGNTTTTTYTDEEISTDASFHGVATDEYVVEFPLGNLWTDPEAEISTSDVTLLSRFEPSEGDIWASQNGNTVYIAGGKEQIQMSGAVEKAVKVQAFEVGNLKGDGGDIIDQCFNLGLSQTQTTDPDNTNASSSSLFLDAGCQAEFEHVKVGSEWWLGAVKVKESAEVTNIEITNYGYEWYELDTTGVSCTRQVSLTQDSPNAILFVEYDLITSTRESKITKWAE